MSLSSRDEQPVTGRQALRSALSGSSGATAELWAFLIGVTTAGQSSPGRTSRPVLRGIAGGTTGQQNWAQLFTRSKENQRKPVDPARPKPDARRHPIQDQLAPAEAIISKKAAWWIRSLHLEACGGPVDGPGTALVSPDDADTCEIFAASQSRI